MNAIELRKKLIDKIGGLGHNDSDNLTYIIYEYFESFADGDSTIDPETGLDPKASRLAHEFVEKIANISVNTITDAMTRTYYIE